MSSPTLRFVLRSRARPKLTASSSSSVDVRNEIPSGGAQGQVYGVYLNILTRGGRDHLVLVDPPAAGDDQRDARLPSQAEAKAE